MNRAALEHINANTGGATGWCLEVHDLAVSKLVARRERDLDLVRVLLRERVVGPTVLQDRVTMLSEPGGVRDLVRSRLSQVLNGSRRRRKGSPIGSFISAPVNSRCRYDNGPGDLRYFFMCSLKNWNTSGMAPPMIPP
jgi:hypothetical protein